MPNLKITFPYNSDLSENRRLGWSPQSGRMYAQSGYKQAKAALVLAISFAKAQERAKFAPRKRVWVALRVYRSNKYSDAANSLKGVLDAISEAIGVNDRYFDGSFHGLIDRKNPRLEIEILQDLRKETQE